MKKRTLSFDLYRTERYGDDKHAPPSGAGYFITWLQALIEQVPVEHRASVVIDFDDDGDYDSPRPQLSVYWSRPETDEEVNARISDEAAKTNIEQARRESLERQALAALKQKYEPHS